MKKARLSLAWQILIGLVLGIALGALLNHFSAEKAWWISNVLQPAGDIFIRLIKICLLYTSPSPRDGLLSRMPSSA